MTFPKNIRFRFGAGDADSGRRRAPKAPLHVETLEGRALLSTMHHGPGHHAQGMVSAQQAGMGGIPARFGPAPGPIKNEFGVGYAVKSPRLYPNYTGPKTRPDLNAAAARGFLDTQGNLVLDGVFAGQIPIGKTLTTQSQSAYYVFAIDRGASPAGPGPIPGRPNVKFDALVSVAFQPSGTSGSVIDLTKPNAPATPLPGNAIKITGTGNSIRVFVPLGDLPPVGGLDASQYRVNLFARSTPLSNGDTESIASLVPEFTSFRVGTHG